MAKKKPGPKPSEVPAATTSVNLDGDVRDGLDEYIRKFKEREHVAISMSRAINRLLRQALERDGIDVSQLKRE